MRMSEMLGIQRTFLARVHQKMNMALWSTRGFGMFCKRTGEGSNRKKSRTPLFRLDGGDLLFLLYQVRPEPFA